MIHQCDRQLTERTPYSRNGKDIKMRWNVLVYGIYRIEGGGGQQSKDSVLVTKQHLLCFVLVELLCLIQP